MFRPDVRAVRLVSVLLLALGGCEALYDDPWETEPDVSALVELVRDGQRVPREQIVLGEGGLRVIHRTDVFRAREYTVRGHETHRECVPRSEGSGPADKIAHCQSLSTGNSGQKLTAADLAAGVEAFLAAKQAVLHALHRGPPMAAVLRDPEPEMSARPLTAESTIDGLERYWAKYWAHCQGCLGLVWVEVSYQGDRYCTRPVSPAVAGETFRVQVDLNADRIQTSPIEQALDRSACGDRSWFQALWLDDDPEQRTANQLDFR